jgi:hypothetical protein
MVHMGHPDATRIGRAAGQVDAAALELDDEEHDKRRSESVSTVKKSQASMVALAGAGTAASSHAPMLAGDG